MKQNFRNEESSPLTERGHPSRFWKIQRMLFDNLDAGIASPHWKLIAFDEELGSVILVCCKLPQPRYMSGHHSKANNDRLSWEHLTSSLTKNLLYSMVQASSDIRVW